MVHDLPRAVELICATTEEDCQRPLTLPPNQVVTVTLDVSKTAFWYDVVLTMPADPEFMVQYAGRVETGLPGLSDPTIGAA